MKNKLEHIIHCLHGNEIMLLAFEDILTSSEVRGNEFGRSLPQFHSRSYQNKTNLVRHQTETYI